MGEEKEAYKEKRKQKRLERIARGEIVSSESDLSEEISDIDEAEYEKFVAQKQADRAQRGMRRAQNGDDNFSDSDNSDYWKEKPGALPKVNDVGDGRQLPSPTSF